MGNKLLKKYSDKKVFKYKCEIKNRCARTRWKGGEVLKGAKEGGAFQYSTFHFILTKVLYKSSWQDHFSYVCLMVVVLNSTTTTTAIELDLCNARYHFTFDASSTTRGWFWGCRCNWKRYELSIDDEVVIIVVFFEQRCVLVCWMRSRAGGYFLTDFMFFDVGKGIGGLKYRRNRV